MSEVNDPSPFPISSARCSLLCLHWDEHLHFTLESFHYYHFSFKKVTCHKTFQVFLKPHVTRVVSSRHPILRHFCHKESSALPGRTCGWALALYCWMCQCNAWSRKGSMHVHLLLVVQITNYVAVVLQDLLCQSPDSRNLKLHIWNLKRERFGLISFGCKENCASEGVQLKLNSCHTRCWIALKFYFEPVFLSITAQSMWNCCWKELSLLKGKWQQLSHWNPVLGV